MHRLATFLCSENDETYVILTLRWKDSRSLSGIYTRSLVYLLCLFYAFNIILFYLVLLFYFHPFFSLGFGRRSQIYFCVELRFRVVSLRYSLAFILPFSFYIFIVQLSYYLLCFFVYLLIA